MADELESLIEERVAELGFELVELERAGAKSRPILRVRVDKPGSGPGAGITVEECARISRALEEHLDSADDIAERYVLEVSSPGVERPLVRSTDFTRFAGQEIALRLSRPMASGAKRLEGELLGLDTDGDGERIRLKLKDGSTVNILRADVTRANLVFRWGDKR